MTLTPTTRTAKGSELTWAELDANFTSVAAALNFLTPQSIAFATAIPLTGNVFMAQHSVAGAITFTVASSPQVGAKAYLRLVADGTNAPVFTGFKEWGGSAGYDNRVGVTNELEFFYDGVDSWYSIMQQIGAVAVDTIAPTAISAAVANATPSIVSITMSEAIDAVFVPATSAFTVSGHTVSNVAISGATISLTVSAAFVNGEAARTVAYTQPGTNQARDTSGNLLASFSSLSITNNVGSSVVAVRVGALNQITESGDGTAGWNYTGSSATWAGSRALLDKKLPANTDAYIDFIVGFTPSGYTKGVSISIKAGNSAASYSSGLYGIYIHQDFGAINAGVFNTTSLGSPALNDVVRLKRVGTTITAEVNHGSGFTVFKTWTGTDTSADLYYIMNFDGTGGIASNLRGTGVI